MTCPAEVCGYPRRGFLFLVLQSVCIKGVGSEASIHAGWHGICMPARREPA